MFPHPLIHAELTRQRQRDLRRDGAQQLPLTPLVERRWRPTARRRIVCAMLAACAVAAIATSAAQASRAQSTMAAARAQASQSPTITRGISFTATSTLTGVCSFDVAVSAEISGTVIEYHDASGAVTRTYAHAVEQDTFSANGKSITGPPFTFNVEFVYDSAGNVTHVYASGLVEKLVLPSGTLFLSAGRSDFAQHAGEPVLLSPDKGKPGDIAAFCGALS
jgi:hypothetical protein